MEEESNQLSSTFAKRTSNWGQWFLLGHYKSLKRGACHYELWPNGFLFDNNSASIDEEDWRQRLMEMAKRVLVLEILDFPAPALEDGNICLPAKVFPRVGRLYHQYYNTLEPNDLCAVRMESAQFPVLHYIHKTTSHSSHYPFTGCVFPTVETLRCCKSAVTDMAISGSQIPSSQVWCISCFVWWIYWVLNKFPKYSRVTKGPIPYDVWGWNFPNSGGNCLLVWIKFRIGDDSVASTPRTENTLSIVINIIYLKSTHFFCDNLIYSLLYSAPHGQQQWSTVEWSCLLFYPFSFPASAKGIAA